MGMGRSNSGKALYLSGLAVHTGYAGGRPGTQAGAPENERAAHKRLNALYPQTELLRCAAFRDDGGILPPRPKMSETSDKTEIQRGLKGVYFDRSRVCYIDGRAGELRYRGYSIHDLAQHSTFEETCYLLLKGELPSRGQLQAFDAELKAARRLPAGIHELIEITKNAHPMEVLRTAASALGAFDPE